MEIKIWLIFHGRCGFTFGLFIDFSERTTVSYPVAGIVSRSLIVFTKLSQHLLLVICNVTLYFATFHV